MLVLTRRLNEKVVVGNGIIAPVLSIRGRTVKLGITAPEGVPIYREEVFGSTDKERRPRSHRPRSEEIV